MTVIHNPALLPYVRHQYTITELEQLRAVLVGHSTLAFPALRTGLFPASSADPSLTHIGYNNVWIRDNVHIAHAHFMIGEDEVARRTVLALSEYVIKHRERLTRIINEPAIASDPQCRPHVRFNGETLEELPERWTHDQNDAWGYFVWLYAQLALHQVVRPSGAALETIALLVKYFAAIQYWQSEDSGHWEEAPRKLAASSVGAVLAGLEMVRAWIERDGVSVGELVAQLAPVSLEQLITLGRTALSSILPWETRIRHDGFSRRYDAALLFLVSPLSIVTERDAARIVVDIVENLEGPYGIKRYVGDSFYCKDYERNIAAGELTKDFSQDMERRDHFWTPGSEAQWCIFDPVMSAYYGRRFHRFGQGHDYAQQVRYFNRTIGQITGEDERVKAFRCPELYYEENGHMQTSKATPLLWTQANLLLALHEMSKSSVVGYGASKE